MIEPIVITSLTQLPPVIMHCIIAPNFELALAEYERKYGTPGGCWQYGNYFYFEVQL